MLLTDLIGLDLGKKQYTAIKFCGLKSIIVRKSGKPSFSCHFINRYWLSSSTRPYLQMCYLQKIVHISEELSANLVVMVKSLQNSYWRESFYFLDCRNYFYALKTLPVVIWFSCVCKAMIVRDFWPTTSTTLFTVRDLPIEKSGA